MFPALSHFTSYITFFRAKPLVEPNGLSLQSASFVALSTLRLSLLHNEDYIFLFPLCLPHLNSSFRNSHKVVRIDKIPFVLILFPSQQWNEHKKMLWNLNLFSLFAELKSFLLVLFRLHFASRVPAIPFTKYFTRKKQYPPCMLWIPTRWARFVLRPCSSFEIFETIYVLTDRPRLDDDLSIGATETYRISNQTKDGPPHRRVKQQLKCCRRFFSSIHRSDPPRRSASFLAHSCGSICCFAIVCGAVRRRYWEPSRSRRDTDCCWWAEQSLEPHANGRDDVEKGKTHVFLLIADRADVRSWSELLILCSSSPFW